jgi:hypothetical protein
MAWTTPVENWTLGSQEFDEVALNRIEGNAAWLKTAMEQTSHWTMSGRYTVNTSSPATTVMAQTIRYVIPDQKKLYIRYVRVNFSDTTDALEISSTPGGTARVSGDGDELTNHILYTNTTGSPVAMDVAVGVYFPFSGTNEVHYIVHYEVADV